MWDKNIFSEFKSESHLTRIKTCSEILLNTYAIKLYLYNINKQQILFYIKLSLKNIL